MTKEEKQLLLKDLCARLPYAPQVVYNGITETLSTLHIFDMTHIKEEYVDIKPYLRPRSSMTEEEIKMYQSLQDNACSYHYKFGEVVDDILYFDNDVSLDYLDSIHIDYRGLIEIGLALEAPEGMYETE